MHEIANCNNLVVNNVTWQSVVKLAKVNKFTELLDYLVTRKLYDVKTTRTFGIRVSKKVRKGDLLKVVDKTFTYGHRLPIPCIVKVVSTTNCLENLEVELVSSEGGECPDTSLCEVGDRQFVRYIDLSFIDETNPYTRLSDFILEFDDSVVAF
jgi:hypothetical protein